MAQAPAGLKPVTDPNVLAQLNGAAPAQGGGSTVTPIFSAPRTPTPQTPEQLQNTVTNTAQSQQQLEAFPQQQERQQINTVQGLRQEFAKLPQVANYVAVLPQAMSALRAPATGAGDLDLIYSLGKIMDPGSVVREGELQMASGTGSLGQQLQGYYKSLTEGGHLTPEVRKSLQREILNRGHGLVVSYNQARQQYDDLAKRYGVDPIEVVGPHPAAAWQDTERQFLEGDKPQGQPSGPGDIGFNAPPPDKPLNDVQTAAYDNFWKANPKASADQLRAFGTSIGVNIGNAEEIIKARDAGAGVLGGAQAVSGLTPQEKAQVDALRQNSGGVGNAIVGGAADTATMGTLNKLGSGVEAVAGALDGQGKVGDLYDSRLRVNNAYTDNLQADHPYAYTGGQIAGGFALPMGEVSSAGNAAAKGAAYGAAYGAGSADTIGGAATGAVTGGITGAAIGGGSHALFSRIGQWAGSRPASSGRQAAADLVAAADRQGVTPFPADVGGATTRRLTAAAAQGPISAGPIVRGAQRVTAEAQAARDRIASSIGQALDTEVAGQTAIDGAQKFISRTSKQANALYRNAETLAGDATVPLPKATAALDQHIAELSQTPGGSKGLQALQTLRDEIAGKSFTVMGVRGMRTQLRDDLIKEGLRGSDLERRVKDVVAAASEDMAQGLADQGLGNASSAFKASDRYWQARVDTIDRVLEPIIGNGKKAPQAVYDALNTASQKDSGKLARFVRALPDEDQADIRATFISQLGKVSAGRDNAKGDGFSLSDFLTHWTKIKEPAKAVLFTGESRAALNDLATIADGSKQAQRYANHSNTTGGVVGQSFISGVPAIGGTVIGGPVGGLLAMVGTSGSQFISGKALASARFARWLARAPATGTSPGYINRLSKIATAEPGIAQEILPLRDFLLKAANDNVTSRAAASGPSDGNQKNDGGGGQPSPARRQ